MIAVWSLTGRPFRVGDRTYHPVEATLVPEIDRAMRLQASNLRTLEVDGPADPRLAGVKLRDEDGEPIEGEAGVSQADHEAVVAERDDLQTKLDQAKADAQAKDATIASLTTERDGAIADRDKNAVDLKKANDALKAAQKAPTPPTPPAA